MSGKRTSKLRTIGARVFISLFALAVMLVLVGSAFNLAQGIVASRIKLSRAERAVAETQQTVDAQKKQINMMTSAEGAEAGGRRNGMVRPGQVPVVIELKHASNAPVNNTEPVGTTPTPFLLSPWLASGLAAVLLLALTVLVLRLRALRLRAAARAGTLTPRLELRRRLARATPK